MGGVISTQRVGMPVAGRVTKQFLGTFWGLCVVDFQMRSPVGPPITGAPCGHGPGQPQVSLQVEAGGRWQGGCGRGSAHLHFSLGAGSFFSRPMPEALWAAEIPGLPGLAPMCEAGASLKLDLKVRCRKSCAPGGCPVRLGGCGGWGPAWPGWWPARGSRPRTCCCPPLPSASDSLARSHCRHWP